MKMTVRKKLIGGFSIVLALMCVIGLISYLMFGRAETITDDVGKSTDLNAFFMEKEIDHIKWVAKLSNQFLLNKLFDGELDHHKCGLGQWYYSFAVDKIKNSEFKKLFQELEEPHMKLHETGKRIRELFGSSDAAAKEIYINESRKYVASVQDILVKMRKTLSQKAAVDKNFLFSQIGTTKVSIGFLLFAGVILGVAIAFLVARGITSPLRVLEGLSKKMSSGDLVQQEIKVTSNDEIGDLALTFSVMNRSLADMVSNVLNSADKVSAASQQMSSSSEEMNASSQEISNAIMQVSKGTAAQAAKVGETAKIMEYSGDKLKQMFANAQAADQTIENTSKRLETGVTVVQEATKKIEQLSGTVLETTAVVQGLGKSSQKIGEITQTITSIADQTNLLALNAAIEAARAGEAGRGFAVVAEEVRKLAEGSAESVRKIGTLIKSIQTETESAVMAIQKSSEEVKEGKEKISAINSILVEVNRMAGESSNLAKEIVTGGQERVMEIEQVLKAISEISTIAQESSSATQEITASTEEQTASMQELAASAQELARLAMDLKDLVSKFKV